MSTWLRFFFSPKNFQHRVLEAPWAVLETTWRRLGNEGGENAGVPADTRVAVEGLFRLFLSLHLEHATGALDRPGAGGPSTAPRVSAGTTKKRRVHSA